jgi:hypothetical protein
MHLHGAGVPGREPETVPRPGRQCRHVLLLLPGTGVRGLPDHASGRLPGHLCWVLIGDFWPLGPGQGRPCIQRRRRLCASIARQPPAIPCTFSQMRASRRTPRLRRRGAPLRARRHDREHLDARPDVTSALAQLHLHPPRRPAVRDLTLLLLTNGAWVDPRATFHPSCKIAGCRITLGTVS